MECCDCKKMCNFDDIRRFYLINVVSFVSHVELVYWWIVTDQFLFRFHFGLVVKNAKGPFGCKGCSKILR